MQVLEVADRAQRRLEFLKPLELMGEIAVVVAEDWVVGLDRQTSFSTLAAILNH